MNNVKNRKIAGLDKNVFSAGIVSFLMDVSSEMIYPLIPIFLSSVLSVNKSIIGLIEGIAEATAGVLKTYSGCLSDRLGRRKLLMVLGYGISALSRPVIALSGTWVQVLAARAIDRTGKGIRGAPRDALIADSTPPGELGRSFGFHRAMDTLGAALGPLIAACILFFYTEDYRLVFWISIIPAALAVLAIMLFIKEKRPSETMAERPRLRFRELDSRFKAFLVVATLFSLGNSSDAFLILKAGTVGVKDAQIPLLYLTFNLTYAMTAVPSGLVADRMGRERVILAGFILFGFVYMGFARATGTWQIWGLFMLYGVFLGLTEGVQKAYIGGLIQGRFKGTAYGLYNTLTGLAVLPASIIAGRLWDSYGPQTSFYYGSVTAFAAAGVFLLLIIKTKKV